MTTVVYVVLAGFAVGFVGVLLVALGYGKFAQNHDLDDDVLDDVPPVRYSGPRPAWRRLADDEQDAAEARLVHEIQQEEDRRRPVPKEGKHHL